LCFGHPGVDDGKGVEDQPCPPSNTRYVWPRFALAAVVVAVILAVLWMTVAVLRLRDARIPMTEPATGPGNPFVPDSNGLSASVPAVNTRLAPFKDLLTGGDAMIGRKLFFEKPEANCARCHKAGGRGGETGPVLDGIGARQTRQDILESLIFPNLRIPAGYETVILLLKNGTACSGFLKEENESEMMVQTAEDGLVKVNKGDVQIRQKGISPMPEGLNQILSREDLRNLVEFVSSLRNQ
jgi:putative heme-binding domain-containing protein